jgi:uncharacterized protein
MKSWFRLFSMLLLTGCARPAPQVDRAVVGSPRSHIVPLVDAHQHMMSPAAMALTSVHPPLPIITLPADLERVLRAREAAGDPATFASAYTADAIMLAEEQGRWWKGEERILDAISNLPSGFRFIPKTYAVGDAAGFISGNVRRSVADVDTHSFMMGIRKTNGGWRIASEMMMPVPPPEYAPPVTAEKVIEVLDDAGIRYGAVLSLGFWFGEPGEEIEDRHAKTRAENDWTVAQTQKYPDRLIPFCGVNPLADYAIQELERCAAIPSVRGMKVHFRNSDVDLTNSAHVAQLREFFRAANRNGLAIVAHINEPLEPFISEVLPEASDIPIQIAHMASGWENAKLFADAIAAGRPGTKNLYFDWTQALPIGEEERTPELMADAAATMRRLGLGRILYGSDMPLRSNPMPRDWWRKTLMTLPLSDDELRDIADNVPPYIR